MEQEPKQHQFTEVDAGEVLLFVNVGLPMSGILNCHALLVCRDLLSIFGKN